MKIYTDYKNSSNINLLETIWKRSLTYIPVSYTHLDVYKRQQIVGFALPAQSSVQERLMLSLMGLDQVAPNGDRVGNHRHHIGGGDKFP